MQIIPTRAVPNQTLTTNLGQQNCFIKIYQKSTGLYIDVQAEGNEIITGALCRDRVRNVRQAYLGLEGDLAFIDTEGKSDPHYTGVGSRFLLIYYTPEELEP